METGTALANSLKRDIFVNILTFITNETQRWYKTVLNNL